MTCQNCAGPHSIQRCPEILVLLLYPYICTDCGDPSPVPVCKACMQYDAIRAEQLAADRLIITGIVRSSYQFRDPLKISNERVVIAGVEIPF